jgi:F-type H+-transporting ATPase subunit b
VIHLLAPLAEGADGAEEMPSVLSIPIDELVIGLIAFLVVFGVLAKLVLPGIKKTLEERTDAIEGGLQRAEEAQVEAQHALEEYKAQLAQAREEAAAIRAQAQADKAAMIEEARDEARAAAAAVTAQAEQAMAVERQQAMSQLTRQVGDVAVTLASKVVGETLSDDARVSATVDAFLADLEAQAAAGEAGR